MKKNLAGVVFVIAAAGMLTGCGSNVAEHTDTYFSQMNSVLDSALNSSKRIAEAENATEALDPDALLKPENFVVNEDGTFSFDAVEGAASYYVSIYENGKTKEAKYTYVMEEDGSASYSGTIGDILDANASMDFMGNLMEADRLTYGAWSVRVSAVPDYTADNGKKASPEAKAVYSITGEVEYGDIVFASMWNTFSNELTVSVNGMNCSSTMYPTEIILTLTNEADSSDVVTVEITDIASDTVEGVTADVQMDAVYSISADFQWDEEFVTNPEYSVGGGEAETSSEGNLITGDFYYVDAIFHSFGFPHIQENFDLEKGGLAGVWYKDPASTESNGFGGMAESTEDADTDKNAYFQATPKAAENEAVYSYDIEITSPAGMIYATPYTDSGKGTTIIWGTLDLYEDGTFIMETEYQYILTDMISSGVFYIPGSICEGKYTTNADGTVNLNYDHTNCYESDYELVTELTGKAAEYAADHPDFVQKFEMPSFMAGGDTDFSDDENDAAAEETELVEETVIEETKEPGAEDVTGESAE